MVGMWMMGLNIEDRLHESTSVPPHAFTYGLDDQLDIQWMLAAVSWKHANAILLTYLSMANLSRRQSIMCFSSSFDMPSRVQAYLSCTINEANMEMV